VSRRALVAVATSLSLKSLRYFLVVSVVENARLEVEASGSSPSPGSSFIMAYTGLTFVSSPYAKYVTYMTVEMHDDFSK
jgi:hypothetical protein